ncbi:MAG: voltage-gated potassium channel [Campylobacterota bacterium]|nr:voltage-gated potassium channel [Campylobacterota bacterium]
MKRLILKIALALSRSESYKTAKSFVRNILNNPLNPYKKYVDLSIIFFIITSVFILVYEVKHPVPEWIEYYDIYVVSAIFLIEYLLRVWVHADISPMVAEEYRQSEFLGREFRIKKVLKKGLRQKVDYMLTPSAIIDLLAIFPAYRPLRILRIFVLFRVFKLLRYAKSINQFTHVLSSKRFELLTLLFLLVFVVMTAGIALYVIEEQVNPYIESPFDAIYWALVTISTVGYGDIFPVTDVGRTISMVIIISGIAMISFATSVIVSAFSEKLVELKEVRIIEKINKNKEFLIICGYGQMTKMFFAQNEGQIQNYVILENNPLKVHQAQKDGFDVIQEDASRYETLSKFNAIHAKITLLCLTRNDVENIYITLNAKSVSSKIDVIARASSREMVKKFERAGADHILLPSEVADTMIRTAISHPTMYKAVHAILAGKGIARIDEIHVLEHDMICKKRVDQIDFKAFKLLFIGIYRGKGYPFMFIPSAYEIFQDGDVLLVMGQEMSIDYFKDIYQGSSR